MGVLGGVDRGEALARTFFVSSVTSIVYVQPMSDAGSDVGTLDQE